MTRAMTITALLCLVCCDKGSSSGGSATGASASATTSGASTAPAADTATTGPIKECEDFWNKVEACMLDKADKEKDPAKERAVVHQSMPMLRSTSSGGTDRGGRMALAVMCKKWSATFSQDTCGSTLTNPTGH
jgi:hypothetical protein